MERRLEINAFRNVGFENEKPGKQSLLLNRSLKKGLLGDLVILIGANNSGKSNVLDAIKAYKRKRISQRDVTDLYVGEECRKPSLKLTCKNGQEEFGLRLFDNGETLACYPGSEKTEFEIDKRDMRFDPQALLRESEYVQNMEEAYVPVPRLLTQTIHRYSLKIDSSHTDIVNFLNAYIERFKTYLLDESGQYSSFIDQINYNCPILLSVKTQYLDYLKRERNKNSSKWLEEKFDEKFGFRFEPNIYEYSEESIGNRDLSTSYNSLISSKFILSVLRIIDEDPKNLINAYEDATKLNNRGILRKTQNDLNRKLVKVSDRFNQLYYLDDAKYSFEFELESGKIFFTMYRGGSPISLDYQSTGFKWFFDLYFNLFASTDLKPGDIVLMDEPATNLHVRGQIELRGFLKEFARRNDVTIVIATHSPFLIDLDFLDELRIIVNKGNVTSIENNFSAINPDDPDSLAPIKESLTVENHVLLDPDKDVIFVEGITDYNYLVGMGEVLGYKDLVFLPIEGLGKKGSEKIISERLVKIRKHHPVLLADGDAAGKAFKKVNHDSELKVVLLTEIDEKFKEIEDLFAGEDAKKFGLIDPEGKVVKRSSASSLFKNAIISDSSSVSSDTKENFKKVFDFLID